MFELSGLEAKLIRAGGSLLSRGGRGGSLLVLIYHRVLAAPDPLLPAEPHAEAFAAQMDLLAANFNVLPLREAVARLQGGALPVRALSITFDDGYANNCDVALPILVARGLPATVFIAAGFLNGKQMFNDVLLEAIRGAPDRINLEPEGLGELDISSPHARLTAWEALVRRHKYLEPAERMRRAEELADRLGVQLRTDLMMTDAQVQKLHQAGVEIGAHTMTHPILARIDNQAALREMSASRLALEEITGSPVHSFAYPNGKPHQDYERIHVQLVREAGFNLAVSTAWGAATAASDMLQIPRVAPWDRSGLRYAARLAAAYRQRRYQTV